MVSVDNRIWNWKEFANLVVSVHCKHAHIRFVLVVTAKSWCCIYKLLSKLKLVHFLSMALIRIFVVVMFIILLAWHIDTENTMVLPSVDRLSARSQHELVNCSSADALFLRTWTAETWCCWRWARVTPQEFPAVVQFLTCTEKPCRLIEPTTDLIISQNSTKRAAWPGFGRANCITKICSSWGGCSCCCCLHCS